MYGHCIICMAKASARKKRVRKTGPNKVAQTRLELQNQSRKDFA